MQTITSIARTKSFLTVLAYLLFAGVTFAQYVDVQAKNPIQPPSKDAPATARESNAGTEFRAMAFPVLTPMQVRVVFENPTSDRVHILVRNSQKEIIYSRIYPHTPKYYGLLDFSHFPDGAYTVQVGCCTKTGKIKYGYQQTFQINSRTGRAITASDKKLTKQLYTKRAVISGR